jgi:AraC family transcriptional regulator
MGAIESCLEEALRAGMTSSTVSSMSGRLSRRRLARAITYIQDHLHENVRLDDIAAAAGLSVYHFSRAFRTTTGASPYRYLLRCRVEKVRELLGDDGRTLAGIAVDAGFADQSHMCNVFKRLTGTTPKGFRDALNEAMRD